MENSLFRADKIFNISVPPVMMFLSFAGNSLAFLVLSRKSFSKMPMSVYLRFLAVMDVGTVVTGLIPRFILALTDYDVRGRNELSCQCQVYIVYIFTELSAWTLVIVTSERVLSIIKPLRVKVLCTKSKSYNIITVAALMIIIANIPIFFIFGIKGVPSSLNSHSVNTSHVNLSSGDNQTSALYRVCGLKDTKTGSAQVWFLTHFIKQSLLPFILIFALNIIIIFGLLRRRSSLLKSCVDQFTSRSSHRATAKRSAEVHVTTMSRQDASLSVTLVTINAVFMICNFPIGIYQQFSFGLPDSRKNSELSLIYSVLVFFLYLNNTLNFILYSATGSRFRKQLHNMLTCTS